MLEIRHLNCGWLHAPPLPPACCHCLLINDGKRIALVDTGIGRDDIADPIARIGQRAIATSGFQFFPEVTAAYQLEQLDIPLESVTDIILTHGDADHVGGLSDFPDANIHLSAEELDSVGTNKERYSSAQFSHGPRWQTYAEDDSTLFDLSSRVVRAALDVEIRLVPLFGHTKGHCGVAIRRGDSWLFHVGDAYYLRAELEDENHPIDELATIAAVNDPLRRLSLRKLRTLAQREPEGLHVFGYHDTSELPPAIPQFADVA